MMRKSPSIASTMAEGALLMKEEDAAILERGVRDSCSSGSTPVLAPISPPSLKNLPLLTPADVGGSSPLSDSHELFRFKPDFRLHYVMEQEGSIASFRSEQGEDEHDNNLISLDSAQFHQFPHNAEISKDSGLAKVSFRRCLSGNIRPISGNVESIDHANVDLCMALSPVSVAEEVQTATVPLDQTESVEGKNSALDYDIKTSKSHDRRLNEAAQFAEAVGELPPLQVNEVQEIIEEAESDSDDDSNNEGHHHIISSDRYVPMVDSISIKKSPEYQCAQTVVNSSHVENSSKVTNESLAGIDENLAVQTLRRPKIRPDWPFKGTSSASYAFLHKLPEEVNTQDFVYKGICSNPPEITKRGISRGNYAQLHRKAWLEVSDKYHRYGKNLRLYYRYWERLTFPTNQFFDWLDSKGEAAGEPLPNLPECPRSQLDSDTVLYITNPEITQKYALAVVADEIGRAIVLDVDGDPVKTGPDGWIFVLRDNTMYGAKKVTSLTGLAKQRFHHSSFFCGKAVAAAGIFLTDENGVFTRLYPHSGHYRPGEADMQRMLFYLHHNKINLRTLDMDTQQIHHVTRQDTLQKHTDGDMGKEKKKKKVDSLHLLPAVFVACFLAHKARFIGEGVFDQIHKIRNSDVISVSEALIAVDGGT